MKLRMDVSRVKRSLSCLTSRALQKYIIIKRTCRDLDVKAVFKSQYTLRRCLTRVKTARPDLKEKEVFYEVPCMDCDSKYVGEAGRNLQKQLSEHKAAVRKGDRNDGIVYTSRIMTIARIGKERARVIGQKPHFWKRRMLEALHISRCNNSSNLDCGLTLDSVWDPINISAFPSKLPW